MEKDKKDMPASPMMSKEGKDELYMYSLKKMAEKNVQQSRVTLTDLLGNNAFLYKANEHMHDNPELKFALIRMDIYRFKTVNEFCGRKVGDGLLKFISDCFRVYESDKTAVGHMRADIFALCTPYEEKEDLIKIVTDINNRIDQYQIACKVLPAFGICTAQGGMDVSLMTDYANLALQKIKGKVFSFYAFYDEEMRQELLHEKKVENDIIIALRERQLETFIQPKVDMESEDIIGGEALLRWRHPEDGYLMPGSFIQVLEKSGYIIEVDMYIWEDVFKNIRDWLDHGIVPVPISINVSRLHAYQKDFKETLCRLATRYNVSPELVKLEITESFFEENQDELFEDMRFLRDRGFKFSMDDFGSGYSSMNMLKDEPVDEVKLDRVFLSDMQGDKGRIIVANVIRMINELGIDMIAEGVETTEQAEFLSSLGCYKAQGYLYYKPMPIDKFTELLSNRRMCAGEIE